MTALTILADTAPHGVQATLTDFDAIAEALVPAGVGLERWAAGMPLDEDADNDAVMAAYAADIDALKVRGGYQSVDVVRMTPDHPDRAAMRAKFLSEHVHDDDEVRFFVEGSGRFYIRHDGRVHVLECTAGDLIVLPKGTRHWFDAGEAPHFTAIRLFTTPEGWVATFTGDPIAETVLAAA